MNKPELSPKRSVVFSSIGSGVETGVVLGLVTHLGNFSYQMHNAREIEGDIVEFSRGSHNKWVQGMALAGAVAGATYGAIHAKQHNDEADAFTRRVEADKAAQINAGSNGKA